VKQRAPRQANEVSAQRRAAIKNCRIVIIENHRSMARRSSFLGISNKSFNLINPLSWFLREDYAKTTPSLRNSSGADLKVKPMLERRSRAGRIKDLKYSKSNCNM
jgi:hypothetical protein